MKHLCQRFSRQGDLSHAVGSKPEIKFHQRETLSLASPWAYPGLFAPQRTLTIASITRFESLSLWDRRSTPLA